MKMNKEMAAFLYINRLQTTAIRTQLVLIEGGEISTEALANNYNNSAALPVIASFATIYNHITAANGRVIAVFDFNVSEFPIMGSAPDNILNFQTSQAPTSVVNEGRPDWFLLYTRVTNIAYNANGPGYFCIKGTVSDTNGDGDLQVDDAFMDLASAKKVLNMRFRQRLGS